jgi:cell division protein FtsQ
MIKIKKGAKRGLPRKKALPLWRRQSFFVAMVLLVGGVLSFAGWQLWTGGTLGRTADALHSKALSWSKDLGFSVQDILVSGRRQTERKEILEALGVARGGAILGIDLDEAKRRLEELPWINTASAERILPDTIFLHISEHEPFALWQNKGAFSLINGRGEVIPINNLERFSDLLLVVGEDAPDHASELLGLLTAQPELMNMVKAAVWVGGRRWNIRLTNSIDVRLPEKDPVLAWNRLAEYEREHQVLGRDVQVLDLRLPDRLIVQKARHTEEMMRTKGRET